MQDKEVDRLDQNCRDYLGVCGSAVLASADAQGPADVTPRAAPRVRVLDDRTLASPDATGNRRLDTFRLAWAGAGRGQVE